MIRHNLTPFLFSIIVLMQCKISASENEGISLKIIGDSTIYLPDYSFAGYHHGEVSIPNYTRSYNVSDYGAIPNDEKDDTQGIITAIAEASKEKGATVVKFSPGKFILKKIIFIERSNFVLQGSGSDSNGTIIYCPTPLRDLPLPKEMEELNQYLFENNKRDKKTGKIFSPFSWTGGLIWVQKKESRPHRYLATFDKTELQLASVDNGKRGSNYFTVKNVKSINENLLAKLLWFNRSGSQSTLLRHLYGNGDILIGSHHWNFPDRPLIEQIVTIKEIQNDRIYIKEPLLHDVKSEWSTILAPADLLTEVGIEKLRIEFPQTDYGGHHLEEGFNAIYISSLANSWVRDVKVINADNAILSDDCAFITIQNLEVSGRAGHYGLHLGKSNHILAKNIVIDSPMVHSISANTKAKANVFHDIDILQNPTIDQHCGSNHQNLFDNIRVTIDSPDFHLFKHGGAGYWKPTHGKYNTFWNIAINFDFDKSEIDTVVVKGVNDGPSAYLVGLYSNDFPIRLEYGPNAYFESINQPPISVNSLYEYQFNQRQSINK